MKWSRYGRHTPHGRPVRWSGKARSGDGGGGGAVAGGWCDPAADWLEQGLRVVAQPGLPPGPGPGPGPGPPPNAPGFTLDDPLFGVLDGGNRLG